MRTALRAVLAVLLAAFVAIAARVQHGVLRAKHWGMPAMATVAASMLGLYGWMQLAARPNGWMW